MQTWKEIIEAEAQKDYFKKLMAFVQQDAKNYTIYPPRKDIFNAFKFTSLDKVKAVLLAQDPFINTGEAMGLCFSVPKNCPIPPSLRNIYTELKSDLGIDSPNHGCLIDWAKSGVLLLNTVLTVRAGQSGSHKLAGWLNFSDKIISILNDLDRPIVFLLFGAYAKSKSSLITNQNHCVISTIHPSPMSAYGGFFGSKPFSKANNFLIKNNIEPINWQIT